VKESKSVVVWRVGEGRERDDDEEHEVNLGVVFYFEIS